MLLADKHDLQQRLKLQILQIEEKELIHCSTNNYTSNASTLGGRCRRVVSLLFGSFAAFDWNDSVRLCCLDGPPL